MIGDWVDHAPEVQTLSGRAVHYISRRILGVTATHHHGEDTVANDVPLDTFADRHDATHDFPAGPVGKRGTVNVGSATEQHVGEDDARCFRLDEDLAGPRVGNVPLHQTQIVCLAERHEFDGPHGRCRATVATTASRDVPRSSRTTWAALRPGCPEIAPPGCVVAPVW